jgi:hypothetical protein
MIRPVLLGLDLRVFTRPSRARYGRHYPHGADAGSLGCLKCSISSACRECIADGNCGSHGSTYPRCAGDHVQHATDFASFTTYAFPAFALGTTFPDFPTNRLPALKPAPSRRAVPLAKPAGTLGRMGSRGLLRCLPSSRAVAALSVLALLSIGCGNPFKQFYRGSTISDIRREGWVVDAPGAAPPTPVQCVAVPMAQYIDAHRNYLADGWLYMGGAAWSGDPGNAAQATEQAKQIGASLVLFSYEYRGTATGSIPITSPTTSTTYATGTAYSTTGSSAMWSGSATTYGTQTTMMAVPIRTYSTQSSFYCRRIEPPVFGIIPRPATTEEQRAYGTVNGIVVDIVIRGSPAANAGFLPGDLLLKVSLMPTDDIDSVARVARNMRGMTVEAQLIRNGTLIKRMVMMNP